MSDSAYSAIKNDLIIGIDILKSSVVVSLLARDMNDPATLNAKDSDATRHIPQVIAKEQSLGRWYIGEEAIQKARIEGATSIENLYELAYSGQTVEIEGRNYSCIELFSTFIRRVIGEAGFETDNLKKLVMTVAEVDERVVELFAAVAKSLSLAKDVISIIDHRESFIFYTLSQSQNIHQHDVALFECDGDRIVSNILSKDTSTRPQVVDISVDAVTLSAEARDREFALFIEKVFGTRIVMTVFMIGEGFSDEWMKDSLNILCQNRRVFMGDNLYSKGACHAGRIKLGRRPWPYFYIGDHEMKMNLSLKVLQDNDMSFFTLVTAGQNWYEAGGECEVILDGSPEFECWIQSPETRRAKVTLIELKQMPKRENRTSRLRITAVPVSNERVRLSVRDLGFGDIAPSTGRMWEHMIDMSEDE